MCLLVIDRILSPHEQRHGQREFQSRRHPQRRRHSGFGFEHFAADNGSDEQREDGAESLALPSLLHEQEVDDGCAFLPGFSYAVQVCSEVVVESAENDGG